MAADWWAGSLRHHTIGSMMLTWHVDRDHFVNAPSQWKRTLHCNTVFHWLGSGYIYEMIPAWIFLSSLGGNSNNLPHFRVEDWCEITEMQIYFQVFSGQFEAYSPHSLLYRWQWQHLWRWNIEWKLVIFCKKSFDLLSPCCYNDSALYIYVSSKTRQTWGIW